MSGERFARWMRRGRRGAGGVAAWFFLGAPPVAAQTCPCPTFDLPAIVQEADAIFVGRALSATNDSTGAMRNSNGGWVGGADSQTRLLFDVQTVIKGAPPRFVEVVTPINPCMALFSVGETYLVVSKGQGAAVTTDTCKGNVSGSDAIDTRVEAIRNVLQAPPMPRETRERR